MKSITIVGNYHHKNKYFLQQLCSDKKYFNYVSDINSADIVLSADRYISIENYPNKYFIFGPHFSVFPNNIVKQFKNKYNNACYIQPSEQSRNTWMNEFHYNILPIFAIPFGVNTESFNKSESITKSKVFVYYKNRNPDELKKVEDFLKNKDIEYRLFSYKNRYREEDYKNYLQQCKYGIWIGSHESQGFALNEALSCNVPLLVWNVTLRSQEWPLKSEYKNVKSNVTTIPYWDNSCGEYFYSFDKFEETFNKFINNLELGLYKPREFIINNLSIEHMKKIWYDFIMDKVN